MSKFFSLGWGIIAILFSLFFAQKENLIPKLAKVVSKSQYPPVMKPVLEKVLNTIQNDMLTSGKSDVFIHIRQRQLLVEAKAAVKKEKAIRKIGTSMDQVILCIQVFVIK